MSIILAWILISALVLAVVIGTVAEVAAYFIIGRTLWRKIASLFNR